VRWWVGTARFCVQEGCFFPCKILTHLTHTAPSPHRRINAPRLLLAFAHIQGEAGTPTGGVGSAVVGRNSPVLRAGGCFFPCKILTNLTHTAPSPHRRINVPRLLLAFAHIPGEAGTPTGGVGSAVVGRNSPVLCAGGVFLPVYNDPSFALFYIIPVSAQANQCT
jgi:hypothetical protein